MTIDHVLVEEPIKISDYDVMKVDNTDHRAIYTELVVPGTRHPSRFAQRN